MTPAASRVVIRAPNWLGDAVLALPAMAALRRHFADAHLTIAAKSSIAPLFRERTGAAPDAVLEVPDDSRRATQALRDGAFDIAVLLPNSFRSAWVTRRAGIRERWGFATSARGLLLTRKTSRPRGVMHQADYYRSLVRALGVSCGEEPPALAPSDASRERASALLEEARVSSGARLVGVAPGAAYGSAKQWPTDRMAAVIARVVRDAGATCLILGAAHDRTAAREIESALRATAPDAASRAIDLVGRTTLGTLAAMAARVNVFISNDSGAMHLAAATGRPVVAMFGPTDERATRPLGVADVLVAPVFCRPCMLRDCPIDHRCMTRITVERVVSAAMVRLSAASTS